jgi:hypothetical protein
MRGHSGLAIGAALALTLLATADVFAHRTEDYLQAARIGVEPDRIQITLDLTPGTAVAESFLAAIDRDGDGSLSAAEQREYARQMVSAWQLDLDGRSLPTRVRASSFPDAAAVRRGEGTIRLDVEATVPDLSPGSHRLLFRNAHLAGHSAYLANALVPESDRVAVTAQRRDRDQSELIIEYTMPGGSAAASLAGILSRLTAALRLP